jgi:hypothetical protein
MERRSSCARGVLLPIAGLGFRLHAAEGVSQTSKRWGTRDLDRVLSGVGARAAVSGVIPGSMFFLASYRLHAWSYIKNSQLIVAHRLAERYDR